MEYRTARKRGKAKITVSTSTGRIIDIATPATTHRLAGSFDICLSLGLYSSVSYCALWCQRSVLLSGNWLGLKRLVLWNSILSQVLTVGTSYQRAVCSSSPTLYTKKPWNRNGSPKRILLKAGHQGDCKYMGCLLRLMSIIC